MSFGDHVRKAKEAAIKEWNLFKDNKMEYVKDKMRQAGKKVSDGLSELGKKATNALGNLKNSFSRSRDSVNASVGSDLSSRSKGGSHEVENGKLSDRSADLAARNALSEEFSSILKKNQSNKSDVSSDFEIPKKEFDEALNFFNIVSDFKQNLSADGQWNRIRSHFFDTYRSRNWQLTFKNIDKNEAFNPPVDANETMLKVYANFREAYEKQENAFKNYTLLFEAYHSKLSPSTLLGREKEHIDSLLKKYNIDTAKTPEQQWKQIAAEKVDRTFDAKRGSSDYYDLYKAFHDKVSVPNVG
ncbi:hypothetical protein HYV11_03420 [Candidatus Dependentiae bacterium]|nr:hypothetical protein [Candidatus Dependentiae bacterium]